MTTRDQNRRRHPRVTLREAVKGEVSGRYEVLILDLSLGGARFAHTHTLRPRATCLLRFSLKDRAIAVPARVVWSCVLGRAPDGVLLSESGVAFRKLSDAVRAALAAFFQGYSRPVALSAAVEGSGARREKPQRSAPLRRTRRRPSAASAGERAASKARRPASRRRT